MQKLVATVHSKRGFIRPLNGVYSNFDISWTLKFYQRRVSSKWTHRKDTDEYSSWKEKHICAINHTGSVGALEVVGLKRIFLY